MKCPLKVQPIISELLELLDSRKILNKSLLVTPEIIKFNEVSLPVSGRVHVLGVGKSASQEVLAVVEMVKESLGAEKIGLCLSYTKTGHGVSCVEIQQIEGDHPLITLRNIESTNAFLKQLEVIQANDSVIFLLSGGASALLEIPRDEIPFATLKSIHEDLLRSGESIVFMNEIRKSLSKIKNGGLLNFISTKNIFQLINCDVPNEQMSSVGSAPLIYKPLDYARINTYLKKFNIELSPDLETSHRVQSVVFQSATLLIKEFCASSEDRVSRGLIDCQSKEAVEMLQKSLPLPGEVFVSGGEATVVLPDSHGKGGRNTHFVLSLAAEIYKDPKNQNVHLLSFATDGNDGPTDCAGAYLNYQMFKKLDPGEFLQQFNSLSYMDQVGGSIYTGPTGSNVMDIRLVWREED